MPKTKKPDAQPATAASPRVFRSCVDLFSLDLQMGEDGKATVDIPVLPQGEFQHELYGDLSWTPEKFSQMEQNFADQVTGYVPMLNADHASYNPFASGAPAFGWPGKLFTKPGVGLFATVELTDLGVEAIQNKRYRYISAEVADQWTTSSGEAFENVICGMALTNTPFHDSMPGLFGKEPVAAMCFSRAAGQQFFVGGQTPDAGLRERFSRELATPAGLRLFKTVDGDLSYDDIRGLIREALEVEDALHPSRSCYIREVYPSFFIYEVYDYRLDLDDAYFRRDYTVADGKVTLGTEVTPVEQVWVQRAEAAFSAARRVALKLGRDTPAREAGSGPRGGRMTLLEWARKKFGLSDTASETEILAVAEAAPPAETKPEPTAKDEEAGKQELSRQPSPEVIALQRRLDTQEAELKQFRQQAEDAQKALAREKASQAVDGFVGEGKILPAQREDALEFALQDFDRFTKIFGAAKPQIDTKQYGGLRPDADEAAGTGQGDFMAEVGKRAAASPNSDFQAIYTQVAADCPDLYEAYRKKGSK